ITVRRASPISPKRSCNSRIRRSKSRASPIRWFSWPSSQAIRYCRPLMVTVTWDMASALLRREHRADALHDVVEPAGDLAVAGLQPARLCGGSVELGGEARAGGPPDVELG